MENTEGSEGIGNTKDEARKRGKNRGRENAGHIKELQQTNNVEGLTNLFSRESNRRPPFFFLFLRQVPRHYLKK